MGWVGSGAIIVAALFLLYQHPPSSWTLALWGRASQPSRERRKSIDISPQRIVVEDTSTSQPDVGPVPSHAQENGDNESTQTIPKVNATDDGADDIPIIHLNNDEEGSRLADMPPPNGFIQKSISPMLASSAGSIFPPTSSPTSLTNTTGSSLMPPPPRPRASPPQFPSEPSPVQHLAPPRLKSNTQLRPPPSAASTLRVPSASRLSNSTLAPTAVGGKPRNSSRQVTLEPGHSPLDWAMLTSNLNSKLRGAHLPPELITVTPSMLKAHNGRKGRDAWTSYQGKVYNISPYLPFHPGGKGELLRGAGKDSGKLFMEVHPWVNWDGMLGECLVGILVSENDKTNTRSNGLDAMD
jgi:cytochrome b involved in lipid metabolism